MSGRSKLSLAIALALIGGNAFALGLGSIQVKSGLNQPLDAEIAVTTESAAEAAGLNVSLASAEDFERVGLSRARVTVPIDFSVSTNGRGQPVIKLSTKDIVREPFLDFLVEVNWPKGKLLREYTVLLDPPVTAPAARGAPASVAPAKESVAAPPQKLTEAPKEPKAKPGVKPPKSERGEKQPPVAKAPAPTPAPSASKAPAGGDYGPVAEGETLSEVARATRPDESTNVNQMMLALLKANPNAFYKDNINALKRGAILRIPSNDELKATGNAAAAAAAVHDQNDAWTNGGAAVSKPTIVASTGTPTTPATKPSATSKPDKSPGGEHLALVPPRAGKDSQATADRPGPASGSGGGNASDKAELARTKEALVSREQEATELKSRVKQLEDINTKDQRLLTLKENEIAELQAKLKDLQAGKSTAGAATPPATTTTTTKPADTTAATTKPATTKPGDATKPAETGKPENKLTAEDIWGNIANSEKAGTKPGTPSTTPAPGATPAPSATPSTAATPSATPAPSATPSGTGTPAATPGATPSTAGSTPTPTPTSTTTSTGTTVTPVTSPSTTPPTSLAPTPTSSVTPAATPAATPTATPAPKPTPAPAPETPIWQNTMVQIGAGIVLLLLGAVALLRFMRKPKAVLTPMAPGDDGMPPLGGEEEHHLLDALAQSPGDPHLSLELLRLYYSQRDAGKFEAAAEAMYAHIADPSQPEWQEVRAMGADLCPHNPLFASDMVGGDHRDQAHTVFGHYDQGEHVPQEEHFDLGGHHDTKVPAEENFDFDLTDHSAAPAAPVEDLSFDAEPLDTRVPHAPAPAPTAFTPPPVHAPAPAPAPAKAADDFFAGEDAIGTKLDLAKAYLDMGDPEGARSMLDEVMAEGNDSQKGEARKLLAEIR